MSRVEPGECPKRHAVIWRTICIVWGFSFYAPFLFLYTLLFLSGGRIGDWGSVKGLSRELFGNISLVLVCLDGWVRPVLNALREYYYDAQTVSLLDPPSSYGIERFINDIYPVAFGVQLYLVWQIGRLFTKPRNILLRRYLFFAWLVLFALVGIAAIYHELFHSYHAF